MPALTAHDVRAARFTQTRFRAGYDPMGVDALLERIAASLEALASGELGDTLLSGDEVLDARFRATRFRDGYDPDEVEDFLDRAVLALGSGRAAAQVRAGSSAPMTGMLVAARPTSGQWVRTARGVLVPVRLAPGYAVEEVDALLERAAQALERRAGAVGAGGAVGAVGAVGVAATSPDDLRDARLPTTWWRPGYRQTAVDALLDEVATALGD